MKTRQTPKGQTQYRINGRWMPLGWKPGDAIPAPRHRSEYADFMLTGVPRFHDEREDNDETAQDPTP